jgi:hypothetical protein
MTHPHHWRIAEPEGPTSQGVCLDCGEERTFRNTGPDLGNPDGWRHTSRTRFGAGIDSIIEMRWTTRGEYVR